MSVNQKLKAIRQARGQFSDKQAEFEAYATEFAEGVEAKRDTSELSEARASFRAELEQTDAAFRAYTDEFDDELAQFNAAVDERAEAIDTVRDRFVAYFKTFESDIHAIQDVDGLLDAIDELGAEMAATETMFNEYADRFANDIVAIQDVSELVTAVEALRTEFEDVTTAFEGYAETFDVNVSELNADIADQSDMFAAAVKAFAEYNKSFHEMKVQPMIGDIDAFRAAINAFRAEFSDTEAEFQSFAEDFYGRDETTSSTSADATDNAETAVPINDPPTTSDDAGEPDGENSDPSTEVAPTEETIIEDADEDTDIESVEDESSELTVADDDTADTEISGEAAVATTENPNENNSASDWTDMDVDPVSDGMVRCLVCAEYYQAITEPHLQTHDMSIEDYRKEYGEKVPLRPESDE
jgi:ROS/MUCR transcriptional regulator protein./Halobacterial gas vesicle protein C (GVPC) repeat.